jgi:hypothetical protein
MRFSTPPSQAAIFGAIALSLWFGPAAGAQEAQLPQGPAKALVVEACTQCHAVSIITDQKRTAEDWSDILNRMVDLGAPINSQQQAEILTYLKTTLGMKGDQTALAPTSPKGTPRSVQARQ